MGVGEGKVKVGRARGRHFGTDKGGILEGHGWGKWGFDSRPKREHETFGIC